MKLPILFESQLKDKKLVAIIWRDAVNSSSRVHLDNIHEAMHDGLSVNLNVGWLYLETENEIFLVHGIIDTEELDYFVIPKCCVEKVVHLGQVNIF
jgi:hypothetical protein